MSAHILHLSRKVPTDSGMNTLAQKVVHNVFTPRLLATCGVIAPLLFVTATSIVAALQPNYNDAHQMVSDLGRPNVAYAALANYGGFIVPGILTIAFALGVYMATTPRRGSRGLLITMVLGGVGMIGVGTFSNEPTPSVLFTSRFFHEIAAMLVVGTSALAPVLMSRVIKDDPEWKHYSVFSLVMGLTIAITFPIVFLDLVFQWQGLIERFFAGLAFIWTEAVAIRLFLLAHEISLKPSFVRVRVPAPSGGGTRQETKQ